MTTESELIQQMADVKLNDEEKETVANAFVAVGKILKLVLKKWVLRN